MKQCKIKYAISLLAIIVMMFSCDFAKKTSTKSISERNIVPEVIICDLDMPEPQIIIDSQMTFEEAISGTNAPQDIINQLVLIDVEYYSTDNKLHRGQLLLNKSIEKDIVAIFDTIKSIRFPIAQAIPVVAYDWDDNRSMAANNTYSFSYRKVAGTNNLSRHAEGKAVDINPVFNPLIWKSPNENRPVQPENAKYDKTVPGTLYLEHPVVKEFIKRKFTWGYNFSRYYDIHHFHKK